MPEEVHVLLEGWVKRAGVDFAVDDSAAIDGGLLGAGTPEYFVLVRVGEGTKSAFSLRFYADKPSTDANVVCNSVAKVLARTPRGSSARLVGAVDLGKQVRLAGGTSDDEILLCTAERTISLRDDPKHDAATMLLREYLNQTLIDLAARGSGSIRSTLKSRMSQRLSRVSMRGAGSGSAAQVSAPNGGRRATLRKNKMLERTREIRTLDDILGSPELRTEFRAFLKYAFAEENLEFVEAVEGFTKAQSQSERNRKYATIVSVFVREGSPKQVNLPSFMSRMLVDTDFDLAESQAPVPADIFSASLHEIESLMFRNFFSTFVTQVQQRALRAAQAQEMAGSFASIWTHAGLPGYNRLMSDFQPRVSQIREVRNFLLEAKEISEAHASELHRLSGRFAESCIQKTHPFAGTLSGDGLPPEGSLDRAVVQLYSVMRKREAVVSENAQDIEQFGIAPLRELEATVSSSVQGIYEDNLPMVQRMVDSRAKLQNAIRVETEAFHHLESLRSDVKKGKPTKRQQAQLNKAEDECQRRVQAREACELEVTGIEDTSGEAMMGAFDRLESLELHRLDAMRNTLTQVALAERSSVERLGLTVQGVLFDCVEMNPVNELVNHARDLRENPESGPSTIVSAVLDPREGPAGVR